MACVSLSAFIPQCGDVVKAGTKNTYMISFNDLELLPDSTSVYALTAGVVSQLGLASGKKFVKVKFNDKSESLTSTFTKAENGIVSGTASFAGNILGFNKESNAFVKSLLGQEIVVMQELANGEFVVTGIDGGFFLNEATGTHNATDSGYAVTFGGDIYDMIPTVDKTLVPTLI